MQFHTLDKLCVIVRLSLLRRKGNPRPDQLFLFPFAILVAIPICTLGMAHFYAIPYSPDSNDSPISHDNPDIQNSHDRLDSPNSPDIPDRPDRLDIFNMFDLLFIYYFNEP